MADDEDAFADPAYREAVVDLLGAIGYGELSAFLRLASDAELAPTLTAKASLARLAVVEFQHHEQLCERLAELGAEPERAMLPFVAAIDAFHERTAPRNWLEGLVKYYVGDGIATDFYREVSAFLDPRTRELVLGALEDAGQGVFVVQEVTRAIKEEPTQAGRLALWGRRLVGEALSQAQRVAAERDSFATLLVGTDGSLGAGLTEAVHMFGRITERHMERMRAMGLSG
jgi:hypothetical protein